MYNCVGSTELGSSAGDFLEIRPGVKTRWEEKAPVGLELGGKNVESLGSSDAVSGRE